MTFVTIHSIHSIILPRYINKGSHITFPPAVDPGGRAGELQATSSSFRFVLNSNTSRGVVGFLNPAVQGMKL